jgi:MFS family permease
MSFDNENVMQDQVQAVQTSATELRSGQIFYGWWVVLASAIGLFWGVPISVYSFTVFQAADARVPRWPRSDFAGVHFAPFRGGNQCPVGWVAHRSLRFAPSHPSGDGRVWTDFAQQQGLCNGIRQLYVYYALLGVALHGVGPIPYGSVVCHWFDRRRGLALGLTMVGIGLGAVTMPSLAQKLIARFGWSNAYAILGCAVLLVALPVVAAFLKERPQDLGIVADGVLLKNAEVIPADSDEGLSAVRCGAPGHSGSWFARSCW